jgi:hypothetical protein
LLSVSIPKSLDRLPRASTVGESFPRCDQDIGVRDRWGYLAATCLATKAGSNSEPESPGSRVQPMSSLTI